MRAMKLFPIVGIRKVCCGIPQAQNKGDAERPAEGGRTGGETVIG